MPLVDGLPLAVLSGQVPPRAAAPSPPEHTVDCAAVVGPPAAAPRVTGQQWLQPLPLHIGDVMSIKHTSGSTGRQSQDPQMRPNQTKKKRQRTRNSSATTVIVPAQRLCA